MSREFPTTENALFLALYHSPKRSVTVAAIDLANGRHIWERDASATPGRYQYGDLLDVDTANGTLDLYLPEASRNNRVSISMDGARTRQFSYRGYFWSTGARRHGDLVFVFDGEPRTTTVTALLAVDEISGIVRWRIPTAGDWTSPPVVANDVLLIAAKTKLAALDLPSGRIRWVVALRGQVPPHPPAPLVIDNHVLLAQQLRGKAPPHADWVFTRHVLTTGAERGQVSIGERLMAPTFMRAVGSIVVAEGDVWVDVVDPVIPSLQSSTSFEGTFSRFVFATPRVFLGGADDRGFLVVTSDGKLRYYSVPPPDLTTPRQR